MASLEVSLTVQKALQLLSVIGRATTPVLLSDLVQRAKLSKTVCFRLLTTLEGEGMIVHDDAGGYVLGPKLIELAGRSLSRNALRSQAGPILDQVVRATGDTVLLFIAANNFAICIERRDGDAPVRPAGVDIGGRLHIHTGGAPFALLSFMPADEQEKLIHSSLPRVRPKTVVDPIEIRQRILEVRRTGISIGDEDAIDHVIAVGAPIFGHEGRVVGALSIGGIKQRFTPAYVRNVTKIIRDSVKQITAKLGFEYPSFPGDKTGYEKSKKPMTKIPPKLRTSASALASAKARSSKSK